MFVFYEVFLYSMNSELSQLSQPEADKINFHFIAFVNVNGQLYEFGKHMLSHDRFMYVFLCCAVLTVLLVFKMGK